MVILIPSAFTMPFKEKLALKSQNRKIETDLAAQSQRFGLCLTHRNQYLKADFQGTECIGFSSEKQAVWSLESGQMHCLEANDSVWVCGAQVAASSDRLDNMRIATGRSGTKISQTCQVPESGGGRSSGDTWSPWKGASVVSVPGREERDVIQSGMGESKG